MSTDRLSIFAERLSRSTDSLSIFVVRLSISTDGLSIFVVRLSMSADFLSISADFLSISTEFLSIFVVRLSISTDSEKAFTKNLETATDGSPRVNALWIHEMDAGSVKARLPVAPSCQVFTSRLVLLATREDVGPLARSDGEKSDQSPDRAPSTSPQRDRQSWA
jgi:hypothetical protein